MFENDEVTGVHFNKKGYMQRGNGPASEHTNDGLVPNFAYDDPPLEVDPSMYNYNTSQEVEEPAGSKSILSSLIVDSKSRGAPMSIIEQNTGSTRMFSYEDFPTTPSSLFDRPNRNNRLFVTSQSPQEVDKDEDRDPVGKNSSVLLSSHRGGPGQTPGGPFREGSVREERIQQRRGPPDADGLDHAMQQLYVSGQQGEEDGPAVPRPRQGDREGVMMHERTSLPYSNQGFRGQGDRERRGPNGPQNTTGGYGEMGGSSGRYPGPGSEQPGVGPPNDHSPAQGYRHQGPGPGGAGGPVSGGPPNLQATQAPMHYIPLDGQGPSPSAQGQGAQATYYLQQPMYLDQNGQPIYYRVGPGGPFQDQMIYTSTNPDGSAGEPMMAYMPYPNGQQMGAQGFWPGGVPPDQGYMGVPGPNGPGVDRRMVYPGGPYMMPNGGGPGSPGMRGGPGSGGFPMNDRRMMGGPEMRGSDERKEFRDRERGGRGGSGGGGPQRIDPYGRVSSSVNPMRDPLVDEFRSTYGKSRQWELVDLLGHVVAFCQDQHGSRFIQQKLEVCPDVDKQLIFDEIIPAAHSLMTDVFGNYVLQKLFEYGTPDQCETLALLLTGQSVHLSMQMYGCRVVQKALEYVSTQRLIALVSEFENSQVLLRCVHDSNGNHVIQKCIEIVSKVAEEASTPELSEYLSSRIMFIINSFQGRVKELSSHPYGCRVVQRILEHCSNPQKAVVLEELRKCCAELVQDCYGNYVIQFVMQHGWEADRAVLIKEVQAHLLEFATHKFASNVVEKCLQYASKRDRDEMIWTIINATFDLNNPVDAKTGHCVLESMVRDPYANYVVQKVIDVSDERQRATIMRYVRENITQLRRYTYGKHIIVRLEKITNEKF